MNINFEFLTLVGLLLLGIVGTVITKRLENRERQAALVSYKSYQSDDYDGDDSDGGDD